MARKTTISINILNDFFQESHNYQFESDTDTEVIAKLIKYLWDNREKENISFITLVERVIQQLVCLFYILFNIFIHYIFFVSFITLVERVIQQLVCLFYFLFQNFYTKYIFFISFIIMVERVIQQLVCLF